MSSCVVDGSGEVVFLARAGPAGFPVTAAGQSVAAVREPLTRAASAAAPLMRSSDPAVVTATEQLLNALSDVENTARLEPALEAFGRAVNAATAPRLSWWARRRAARTT
ncbi:hypothetical protein ACFY8C_31550 [Streptomyces flavochromogenes]|uniref:Uncharacterized protein n=1 Tax=Streptomyces flavochromogenes TaxID=68199 RepID=A0ABW6XZ64_9ACTN